MSAYAPPLVDLKFDLYEVLKIHEVPDLPRHRELTTETTDAILDAAGKFAASVLAPLNEPGDRQGSRWVDGAVLTPDGFAAAYRRFTDEGWPALIADAEDGGQGLPNILRIVLDEMLGAANLAFAMCPAPAPGAYQILQRHGSEDLRKRYVPHIVSGRWAVAMSLTEPQCGSALGLIRTRAEPQENGTYRLTGTKMFNSWGDHDMAENIVHLVLARLPGAPEGTRGISLFLVPKFLTDDAGRIVSRNRFACQSLERKLGIHGGATCVTHFDGATAYLVGAANQGLPNMFIMMNSVRLSTGIMATGIADAAYRRALAYTKERVAARSATGPKYPNLPGDPIIVHPDVRRMLMTMRAFTEGARLLCLWAGLQLERATTHPDPGVRKDCDALVSLLTPVIKAYLSDQAFEKVDIALQCFGGHGYIRDNGIEQYLRDERMLRLGEGTSGVQALDLLGRKIVADDSRALGRYLDLMRAFAGEHAGSARLAPIMAALVAEADRLERLTRELTPTWRASPDELGAASLDYLCLVGLLSLAFMWAKMAAVADQAVQDGSRDSFHENKLATAEFFVARLLPEGDALESRIRAGSRVLMAIPDDDFN